MPAIVFSKSDLLESKQLSAGWRNLIVKEVSYAPGKSDPTSNVYKIVVAVEDGPDAGVPINFWLTEKQPARIATFIGCFIEGEPQPGKSYQVEDTKGMSFAGYCSYDVGMRWNTVTDYRKK